MTVRDDYAGSTRTCPKCKEKFDIPAIGEAAAAGKSDPKLTKSTAATGSSAKPGTAPKSVLKKLPPEASSTRPVKKPTSPKKSATAPSPSASNGDDDGEFDPLAFLTGDDGDKKSTPGKTAGQESSKSASKNVPASDAEEFDPLEFLNEGVSTPSAAKGKVPEPKGKPTTKRHPVPKQPAAPPPDSAGGDDEFDPLAVLGEGPAPTPDADTTTAVDKKSPDSSGREKVAAVENDIPKPTRTSRFVQKGLDAPPDEPKPELKEETAAAASPVELPTELKEPDSPPPMATEAVEPPKKKPRFVQRDAADIAAEKEAAEKAAALEKLKKDKDLKSKDALDFSKILGGVETKPEKAPSLVESPASDATTNAADAVRKSKPEAETKVAPAAPDPPPKKERDTTGPDVGASSFSTDQPDSSASPVKKTKAPDAATKAPAESPKSDSEVPRYRRPKPAVDVSVEATPDEVETGVPTPKAKPKRPSWAKKGADDGPEDGDNAAGAATFVRDDASAAAKAAAGAVGTAIGAKEGKLPPSAGPVDDDNESLFDAREVASGFRHRAGLIVTTLIVSALLFAGARWFVGSRFYSDPPKWPERVAVSGRVTNGQSPLAGARVIFLRASDHTRSAEGFTDSDGQYTLRLAEGLPGVPIGRYFVQVHFLDEQGRDIVPVEYGVQSTQMHVVSADTREIDLDVTSELRKGATGKPGVASSSSSN